ncbi:MAG: VanW family protein [Thermomicrobiales bacterium]|nr:VanW family protein [Thermomicrobiales bacterium]
MASLRRFAIVPGAARVSLPRFPSGAPAINPVVPALALAVVTGRIGRRLLATVALLLLVLTAALALLRTSHVDRVYPAILVADVSVGGMTRAEAASALRARATAAEAAPIRFTLGDRDWQTTMSAVGVTVSADAALDRAYRVGREPSALDRLRTSIGLVRHDARIPLPVQLDHARLGQWFDGIDRDLGLPPHDASLAINGAHVEIVPEQSGTVVDRVAAAAALETSLATLQPLETVLPTTDRAAAVTAADLKPARDQVALALAMPVQVSHGAGIWTLPPADLGAFVTQSIDPAESGAAAFSLGMDQTKLAFWLERHLAPQIETQPRDAEVGWNGERLVSVVPSIDGVTLKPDELAQSVERSFFGAHGVVAAPVTISKPTISSDNLGALGITTLLGTGTSNYSGSSDGRATNVQVGAALLNGTLVPPHGEFSFNHAIGVIDADAGFVEAQVIDGESIGQDIGGGICQVSTTAFRAAYFAGMPMTEWWPHRFRIAFYELDGWAPGLDASILQPTTDPSTWSDFKFENPSDNWLLVESWTDGVNVVVNIYGADLGYVVDDEGPKFGEKFQMLADREVVDPEMEPGTINQTQGAGIGEEVSHYRVVTDRDGDLLWEGNFYTKFYPHGNIWTVSPDMAGKSPADPNRPLPPLPKPNVAPGDPESMG